MGFSGGAIHLISKAFNVVQAVANDYRFWREVTCKARKQVRSTGLFSFATYTVSSAVECVTRCSASSLS